MYRSKDSQQCIAVFPGTPDFPYQFLDVKAAQIRPTVRAKTVRAAHAEAHKSSQRASRSSLSSAAQQHTMTNGASLNGHSNIPSQQHAEYGNNSTYSEELAPGWVEYQDPSSGQNYYANTSTGETTWEKPVIQPTQYTSLGASSSQNTVQATKSAQSTPMRLASKYGDGFVTSASHPELGAQYGNVGTSNPYSSSRPGIANMNRRLDKAPVSGTFNIKKITEMADSTEYKSMVDDLLAIVTSLSSLNLQSSQKKLMNEVEKGTAIFSKRLGKSDIETDAANKMGAIVEALKNRDFLTANRIHSSMVNSIWKDNKDWLKGIKHLIQLSSKQM